jgi:NitT/TauT family transport system substrate-binding protein
MTAVVVRRDADAISMWEPQAQDTFEALGNDAIVFQDNRIYRELFSLYSSTEVLNDPKRRREVVAFVRALIAATDRVKTSPREVMPLVARAINLTPEKVSASWKHHAFPAALPPDMLDVITEEERWMAASAGRQPRSRDDLARFIDTSVVEEGRRNP